MNGGAFAEGSYVINSKKSNPIDDDTHNRKGKKNRKRKQHQDEGQPPQAERQELKGDRQQPRREKESKEAERSRIVKELGDIFESFKTETIIAVLEECGFDKQAALERLLEMKPDDQPEQWWGEQQPPPRQLEKTEQGDNSSTSNSEAANNLINEVYDNWEDINGVEFEELFEEIAEMIQYDQKSQGVGMLEINSFVDECNSVKQALLVGFKEEFSNDDDFECDESYPLYAQTQEFLESKIKQNAMEEKQREEDFPTLGSGGGSKVSKGPNIVEKIGRAQKRRRQEEQLFTPSRALVPQFARQRNNERSIFNVDNRLHSEQDMMQLHKQFKGVAIYDLKFIYRVLAGDLNVCREFLIKYYKEKRVDIYKREERVVRRPARRVLTNSLKKEEIDEEVKHLSYEQMRDEIDHLFKLRQALHLTKMQIKGNNQKGELDRLINGKSAIIRKLAQASRVLLMVQMAKTDPTYVDLHGYREEEVDSVLESVSEMLREQFARGSQKVKSKRLRGKPASPLLVMTGKGRHSRGMRSVLKPAVVNWAERHRLDYEQAEDHVRIMVWLS